MLRALLYLRLASFGNWGRSRIRRLREPKYLAGATVGIAYFYLFFFHRLGAPPPRHLPAGFAASGAAGSAGMLPVDWLPAAAGIGALGLFVACVLMWLLPRGSAALGFSEAEIAFLFPAPVTRRGLIHFRLLSTQFKSLFGAFVMMLFSNRWTFLGGNAFTQAVGWWFIFSALNLHFTGSGFSLTRLAEAGVGRWRRRFWVAGGLLLLVGFTWARLPAAHRLPPPLADDLTLRPFAGWVAMVAGVEPLRWVLWPVEVILRPFLALDLRMFLGALAPAFAVLTLLYLWVLNSAVSFEDATIEHARKRSERLAAWKTGESRRGIGMIKGRGAPFRLLATGRPEIAFLWKNLLSTWPYFNLRVLAGSVVLIFGLWAWIQGRPEWRGLLPVAGAIAIVFGCYTLIIGPQFARQDIRSDLANSDIIKIYPLAGWQVVLGQLLAPTAILTGVAWLCVLIAALTFHPSSPALGWLTPQVRIVAALGVAAVIPPLSALQLLVPNAAALLFPGWSQSSRMRGGGVEVLGQRMIFFFAQLLMMLVALIPAMAFATALFFIGHWLAGPIPALLLAVGVVVAVLAAQVAFGVWLLGRRFERLDLSSELKP